METKTFKIITTIAMVFTLTTATLSIMGSVITGFYPAIIVFALLAIIPIASKAYAKKVSSKPNSSPKNYFTALTIFNSLIILVVLWMTFVIIHDRVLGDCC